MKKGLLFFLMLAVITMGAFAQVTVQGGVRVDLGMNFDLGDEPGPSEQLDPQWIFTYRNSGSQITARFEGERVNGFVRWRSDDVLFGDATVSLGDVNLSVGRQWLPFTRLSGFDYLQNGNSDFGASAVQDTYIQIRAFGFYLGLLEGNGLVHLSRTDSTWMPGIYFGYDYVEPGQWAAGFAFAGIHRARPDGTDNVFPFMAKAHGRLMMFNPLTIGLNLAFYNAPASASTATSNLFQVVGGTGGSAFGILVGDDALALEAMLYMRYIVGNAAVNFAAAYVINLADEADGGGGQALQLTLSANFNVGGTGFRIVPGVRYRSFLNLPDHLTNLLATSPTRMTPIIDRLDVGLTFMYAF